MVSYVLCRLAAQNTRKLGVQPNSITSGPSAVERSCVDVYTLKYRRRRPKLKKGIPTVKYGGTLIASDPELNPQLADYTTTADVISFIKQIPGIPHPAMLPVSMETTLKKRYYRRKQSTENKRSHASVLVFDLLRMASRPTRSMSSPRLSSSARILFAWSWSS